MSVYCRTCRHAFVDDWGKEKDALRCGNKANGERCGRVVDIFPKGRRNCITNEEAPKWCILTKGTQTA